MTLDEIIQNAQTVLGQIKTFGANATGEAKDKFSQYGSQIQSLLDNVLRGYGVVKQDQVDLLDFQTRQAKIAMLEFKSRQTTKKYATIAVVSIFVLAALFVIVKKTNKTAA